MNIGIVGSGAMGSVYGALLADAGNELWMFDKWREHVLAMRERGLRCEGASGDRTVRLTATTSAAEAGPCELAIVATKVMDIEAAVRAAAAMIGPQTLVLAIQNGLGNVDRIRRVVSAENLLFGIAGGFGAELLQPASASKTTPNNHAPIPACHLRTCHNAMSRIPPDVDKKTQQTVCDNKMNVRRGTACEAGGPGCRAVRKRVASVLAATCRPSPITRSGSAAG
jgi:hypothetical protein